MIEKIKKIADHYEFEIQSRHLTEECAELIQAVNKYYRYDKGLITSDILTSEDVYKRLTKNIKEEIADVEVMIEQIKYLLNINPNDIEEIKKYKVDRQLERIKREI